MYLERKSRKNWNAINFEAISCSAFFLCIVKCLYRLRTSDIAFLILVRKSNSFQKLEPIWNALFYSTIKFALCFTDNTTYSQVLIPVSRIIHTFIYIVLSVDVFVRYSKQIRISNYRLSEQIASAFYVPYSKCFFNEDKPSCWDCSPF